MNPNLKENKLKRAVVLPFKPLFRAFSPVGYVRHQYKYITYTNTLVIYLKVRYSRHYIRNKMQI